MNPTFPDFVILGKAKDPCNCKHGWSCRAKARRQYSSTSVTFSPSLHRLTYPESFLGRSMTDGRYRWSQLWHFFQHLRSESRERQNPMGNLSEEPSGTDRHLSGRIRWLAIATGIASALALFPYSFFYIQLSLIAGGIMQPRFPTTGKWFVWAGATSSSVGDSDRVRHNDFSRPLGARDQSPRIYGAGIFDHDPASIWCSVELVADAVRGDAHP